MGINKNKTQKVSIEHIVIAFLLGSIITYGIVNQFSQPHIRRNQGYVRDSSKFVKQGQDSDKTKLSELIDEFEKNEIFATNKYKDHYITTTGYVDSILQYANGVYSVTLQPVSNKNYTGAHLECRNDKKDYLLGIKKGQKVKVKGKFMFLDMNTIVLKNCVIE